MTLLRDHPLLHRYLHARCPNLKASRFDVSLAWGDETELVGVIDVNGEQGFLGGEAVGTHRAKPDDYRGLSADECLAIRHYRAFRLFRPWPQPTITIAMTDCGHGEVVAADSVNVPVRMMEIGSSQAWWGDRAGVIWEVLLSRWVARFTNRIPAETSPAPGLRPAPVPH